MEVLDTLNDIIKQLEQITIIGEFSNLDHFIELCQKGPIFFVKLDGAILYAGAEPERAVAVFYDQISKVHEDEENGTDPGFATLREILVSRNEYVQNKLQELGEGTLAKALGFLSFSDIDTEIYTEDTIFKDISKTLKILEVVAEDTK